MNPEKNLPLLVPLEAGMLLPKRKYTPEEYSALAAQIDCDGSAHHV